MSQINTKLFATLTLSILNLLKSVSASESATVLYRKQTAASIYADIFLKETNSNFHTDIFNHGCWCGKFNTVPTDKGGNAIDELDQICKTWAKSRHCSRQTGMTCEFVNVFSTYTINYDAGVGTSSLTCPDADECSSETCQIDSYYVNLIKEWRDANSGSFVANENPVCDNSGGGNGANQGLTCDDFPTTTTTTAAPTTTAFPQDVQDALDNAGVDISVKAISVSLTWEGAFLCDFDLFVTDPTGETTSYENSPSSTGGNLDFDNRDGAFSMNVENISWASSPPSGTYIVQIRVYGPCAQPQAVTYVNVDGAPLVNFETNVYAESRTLFTAGSFVI